MSTRWSLLAALGSSVVVACAAHGSDGEISGFVAGAQPAPTDEAGSAPGAFAAGATPDAAVDAAVDCDAEPGACLAPGVCGDGKPGLGESCDDGNTADGDGCSSTCKIEAPYWACAFGVACVDLRSCSDAGDAGCVAPPKAAVCGDGTIDPGEACDDGNVKGGDGCSFDCSAVEATFACPTPGSACVSTVVCGDGKIGGAEQCDDGNVAGDDGCSTTCTLEPGWACPLAGAACVAKQCGDGLVAGAEQCDDGNVAGDDGCSSSCRLAPAITSVAPAPGQKPATTVQHYRCYYPTPALVPVRQICVPTTCGDGIVEPNSTEQCDDGNTAPFDGCSPSCELEPECPGGSCVAKCGDGLVFDFDANGDGKPDEQCDDGNTVDGDGCSSTCKVEPGYACSTETGADPSFLDLPVVLRDFRYWDPADPVSHPDFERYTCPVVTNGLVGASLVGGVPAFRWNGAGTDPMTGVDPNGDCGQQLTSSPDFADWYRDVDVPVNGVLVRRSQRFDDVQIRLTRQPGDGSYVFDSKTDEPYQSLGGFFPIDGRGFGDQSLGHNFAFTTELRYWFRYDAGQSPTLDFSGDDDVWVFVDGKLALDIGGLHPRVESSFTIDAPKAAALGLVPGHLYEVALFHAERHTDNSNFRLTLRGFTKNRSMCKSVCGDGIKTRDEQCDLGGANVDPKVAAVPYGGCTTSCTLGPYCGDKITTSPPEQCDDGVNLTPWTPAKPVSACAPSCQLPTYCGDGKVQSLHGERCDDGPANTNDPNAYGACRLDCTPGPRCGDGSVQAQFGEQCDNGFNVTSWVKAPAPTDCAPGCKRPRYCGDGVVDSPFEQCDRGPANVSTAGVYDSCTTDCMLGPRCGDGIVQKDAGETCDDGNRVGGDGCSAECKDETIPR